MTVRSRRHYVINSIALMHLRTSVVSEGTSRLLIPAEIASRIDDSLNMVGTMVSYY